VAAELKAAKLFLVSNVPGVLRDKNDARTRMPRLTRAEAARAISDGTIIGGMIPKVEESLAMLEQGIEAIHIVGVAPATALLEEAMEAIDGLRAMAMRVREQVFADLGVPLPPPRVRVRSELDRSPKLLAKGPGWLTHALLDSAVDRYLPVIDELDVQIEQLENDVLRKAGTKQGPPILRKILRFKRMLLTLRRMSIHQREILLRLSRGEFDLIPKDLMPFYRDVYDHFLRVNDLVESYRDLVTSALEAYLSVQSNRMNEIMKQLTLVATVMLPITFIAGVYGMNFKHMPELEWWWGYPAALTLMAVIVVGSMIWFWRKGWIGSRDLDVPDDEQVDKAADE